jgi:hypothetical protein
MATIKGQNLRILIGPDDEHLKCVAAATNCVVHVSAVVEEDTTKDTEDDWLIKEVTGLSWDVQAEALILDDTDEDAASADLLQVGLEYVIRFSQTAGAAGEKNRDAVANEIQYTGSAILSDLQQTSQNQEAANFTAQFTGTGELAPYEPEEE